MQGVKSFSARLDPASRNFQQLLGLPWKPLEDSRHNCITATSDAYMLASFTNMQRHLPIFLGGQSPSMVSAAACSRSKAGM